MSQVAFKNFLSDLPLLTTIEFRPIAGVKTLLWSAGPAKALSDVKVKKNTADFFIGLSLTKINTLLLKSLDIDGLACEYEIYPLIQKAFHLEFLSIARYKHDPQLLLEGVAASCPNLRILRLPEIHQTARSLDVECLSNCPHITELNLANVPFIAESGLIRFLEKQGKRLLKLNLNSCCSLTEKTLEAIGRCCPGLQSLDIGNLTMDPSALRYLNATPSIKHLFLEKWEVSEEQIDVLNSREELSLKECVFSREGFERFASRALQLKKLNVINCAFVTSDGLKTLFSAAPNLEWVQAFSVDIPEEELEELSRTFPAVILLHEKLFFS